MSCAETEEWRSPKSGVYGQPKSASSYLLDARGSSRTATTNEDGCVRERKSDAKKGGRGREKTKGEEKWDRRKGDHRRFVASILLSSPPNYVFLSRSLFVIVLKRRRGKRFSVANTGRLPPENGGETEKKRGRRKCQRLKTLLNPTLPP